MRLTALPHTRPRDDGDAAGRDRNRDTPPLIMPTSYGAISPDARIPDDDTVDASIPFGYSRNSKSIKLSPLALTIAVCVGFVAVMAAHGAGHRAGIALGASQCECTCTCNMRGDAEGPVRITVPGRLNGALTKPSDVDVATREECAEAALRSNYSAWVFDDDAKTCAFYTVFEPFDGDDEADGRVETGCAAPELDPRDGCGLARGWHRTAIQIGGTTSGAARIRGDASACRAYAMAHGFDAWVWMNDQHSNPDIRNSCTFFSAFTAMEDDASDPVHLTGCADAHAKVSDGCKVPYMHPENSVEGWVRAAHRYPRVSAGAEKGPKECREYALANGYPIFLFINEKHPSAWHRFSCAFYIGAGTPIVSSDTHPEWGHFAPNSELVNAGADDVHVSFCADPSKSPLDGCV